MKKARFTDEQIIWTLNETAASRWIRESRPAARGGRDHAHRWRQRFGGLQVPEAKCLKALEEESRRLRRVVADLALENAMPKDVAGREW